MKSKELHSGIYLLPNLFTTASLFAAFYSMVSSFKGQFEASIIAIFIGVAWDGLDGRIARLTNTQSIFGAEYDSLADMVTFGVAPALLVYSWSLQELGKFGWLVAFFYTATVAFRLARFSMQIDKRFFTGLPCPSGAGVVSSALWLCVQHEWQGMIITILTAILVVFISILMSSQVKYYSFKEIDFRGRVPFLHGLIVLAVFVAIAANPPLVLFLGFMSYACYGVLFKVKRVCSRRKRRQT